MLDQQLKSIELPDVLEKLAVYQPNVQDKIVKHIIEESGLDAYDLISAFAPVGNPGTQVLSTTTLFNISTLENNRYNAIVNLKRINDFGRINRIFETINEKLVNNGIFIGCCETLEFRKTRLLNKYPGFLNYLYLGVDYLFKRVMPKLPVTKKIYFALTGGRNRVISRAEVLGRLYASGFKAIHEQNIGYMYYFIAKKASRPSFDSNPSYGLLFGMERTGMNHKNIRVYKFRTMYPYSEYLQQYVYERNNLENGGKFKNDFRITATGRIMRKFWIDELPMIWNFLKSDIKLVGVRPLSKQYQSLYPKDLLTLRHKHKPGLIPPYYADMPDGFDQILDSERRYLESYCKSPLYTDWKYFWKAFVNIVFKSARSK